MNKLELKQAVIDAGTDKMKSIIADFEERVKDLREDAIDESQEESASQSESRRDGELELLDTMVDQLNFAEREMETLKQIKADKIHNEVDFGSVVITDKRNLFVSTGIEEFEAKGKKYFGLSTKAPLYKNMAGLKAGESLSFNGIEYKIQEVF
jgi:transcription elongation GreA/GreB family factor